MITDSSAKQGTLVFEPIPPGELEKIRAAGIDEAGNRLATQVDAEGGNPLRCCLRGTRPGERVLLIAYTPPGTKGPYAERGPVFIHPDACAGYSTQDRYPPELSHRQQVIRAYDHHGRIADGVLVNNGERATAVLRQMFEQSEIALVHLRNVGYGCYNCMVRRG